MITISNTRLDMMSKCGEQYRRRYVEGHRFAPSVAMLVGRAVDRSVTANLGQKIEHGTLLEDLAVMEAARDSVVDDWSAEAPDLSQEEGTEAELKGEAVDKAVRLSALHCRDVAPAIRPTAVQRGFDVPLEGAGYPVKLIGFLDVQEGAESVLDTKTSKKTPPAGQVEKSTQLGIYALAVRALDGKLPRTVAFDYLVDLKAPKAVRQEAVPDEQRVAAILRRIEAFILAHEKGAFVPARAEDWWCSRKWCGYFETCPYAARPVQITVSKGDDDE